MLFFSADVHFRFELTKDETAGALELGVTENGVDAEAALSVHRVYILESANEGSLLAIRKYSSRLK
jgi:hypothetical protein